MDKTEQKKKQPPFELEYRDWKPEYLYSMGELSPFFRELVDHARLMASRCPRCKKVWMYPRGDCPDCYEENEWIPLSGEGTVMSGSYVYFQGHGIDLLSYLGLPFVYALIHLDGTETYIPHCVKSKTQKMGAIRTGTRVKAVFREKRRGTIGDFYFVPIE